MFSRSYSSIRGLNAYAGGEMIILCPAVQARGPVNAEQFSALSAFPFFFLLRNKCIHSQLCNRAQIFNIAFPVFCPVALVQIPDPPTGEFCALAARQPGIPLFFRTASNAAGFTMIRLASDDVASDARVLAALKTQTDITNDPAWSYA